MNAKEERPAVKRTSRAKGAVLANGTVPADGAKRPGTNQTLKRRDEQLWRGRTENRFREATEFLRLYDRFLDATPPDENVPLHETQEDPVIDYVTTSAEGFELLKAAVFWGQTRPGQPLDEAMGELLRRGEEARSYQDFFGVGRRYFDLAPELRNSAKSTVGLAGVSTFSIQASVFLLFPPIIIRALRQIAKAMTPAMARELNAAERQFLAFYRRVTDSIYCFELLGDSENPAVDGYKRDVEALWRELMQLKSLFDFHSVDVTSDGSIFVDGKEEESVSRKKTLQVLASAKTQDPILIDRDALVTKLYNDNENAHKLFSARVGELRRLYPHITYSSAPGLKRIEGITFIRAPHARSPRSLQ